MTIDDAIKDLSEVERKCLVERALGRLFSILARPYREGDVEEYNRCKSIIMAISPPSTDQGPNYVRQRGGGAQGD
jgi:hypothetical protein